MNFSMTILGCKVNAYEAEAVASALVQQGFERVAEGEPADISVVFTCAVTNTASQKSRQMIRRGKRLNPSCIVAAAGCYTQISREMDEDAEIIIGTEFKQELPAYIEEYLRTGEKIRKISELKNIPFEAASADHFTTQTRAYLKIQDGCNQFCSYCIIPYARGRERSLDPESVLKEVRTLTENHTEIVLTGIHTGRYGKEYGVTMTEMIRRILEEETRLQRLRISSIEITEIDDDLIRLMKQDTRIARHLHIPLQSGCDRTLKAMNRPYTTAEYLQRIREIREAIPDISISADLIVGFPGETEEDYAETKEFLRTCEFSFLHVFPFSLRSGTRAEQMSGHLDVSVKKQRTAECIRISEELYDQYKKRWIGRTASVITERNTGGYATGHTSEYIPVKIKGEQERGILMDVRITGIIDHEVYAERV